MQEQRTLYYAKSSGVSPLSPMILLKIFGWRIFAAWKGTVTRLPSAFLKILWLPFCRANMNPLRSSTAIASIAVIRGRRGILPLRHRYFDRREDDVLGLGYFFMLRGHIPQIQFNRIVDVGERFLISVALRIAALKRRTGSKVSIFIFFDHYRETVYGVHADIIPRTI